MQVYSLSFSVQTSSTYKVILAFVVVIALTKAPGKLKAIIGPNLTYPHAN